MSSFGEADRVLRPAGDVVVAQDVRPVERDAEPLGQVFHQLGGGLVHRARVPGVPVDRETLLLDADGVLVEGLVPGVPGDVPDRHHLDNLSIREHFVVRAGEVGRIVEKSQRVVSPVNSLSCRVM